MALSAPLAERSSSEYSSVDVSMTEAVTSMSASLIDAAMASRLSLPSEMVTEDEVPLAVKEPPDQVPLKVRVPEPVCRLGWKSHQRRVFDLWPVHQR